MPHQQQLQACLPHKSTSLRVVAEGIYADADGAMQA